ncbi:23S RNA-specific pseudouridylate synthase [Corynebacterium suranareeae]|uniref:Pseudouridine synthase n=1 Tax=Corynebacterium suranareeae TaxID=2506452 RepID=A0A160PMZ6_9CORY|nr:RluA family pseudouridine synthase [Corynebacterium suranareeae]BAU94706.1 23S RNA-specific pseudouridylate synthase [Corynebacterium suranareeae]
MAESFIEVSAGHADRRIDKFLRAQLKGVPASVIFRQMRKGDIRVNGRKVDPNYRLQEGDRIRLWQMDLPADLPPPVVEKRIFKAVVDSVLFEDAELLVVNKPAGIPVHGGSGHGAGVIEALRVKYPQERDLELVHRLDRDTSGLLLVSKSTSVLRELQEILRDREEEIYRGYLLKVEGAWPDGLRQIDVPLKRTETTVVPHPDGLRARTYFEVVKRLSGATLVKAQLATGRKHQIRVHAQYAGHPIVGDRKYGGRMKQASMMHLHAAELAVPRGAGRLQKFVAPVPDTWGI